ncbi:hypothetical protein GCM10010274_07830 [Streptomyces lavendofoliae]|uniref:ATP-dependent DNA ligase n=1 Tax=Streptomyces lavendofoliae TaxID=67314 RepID=A0A918HTB8_9ACTN|nr:hypothetical protein GCM10010274_07830 [Streptomyces lavendofoliae]
MSTSTARAVRAGRRTVDIHRPDKVLFPGVGITEADLADYHRSVEPHVLPHLRGRPLMLERRAVGPYSVRARPGGPVATPLR